MPDNLATLRAIDEAFDQKVKDLFSVLCTKVAIARGGSRPNPEEEEKAFKSFDAGLDIARQAREQVRERFV